MDDSEKLMHGFNGHMVIPEGETYVDKSDGGRINIIRQLVDSSTVNVTVSTGAKLPDGQSLDPLGGTVHGRYNSVECVSGKLLIYFLPGADKQIVKQ